MAWVRVFQPVSKLQTDQNLVLAPFGGRAIMLDPYPDIPDVPMRCRMVYDRVVMICEFGPIIRPFTAAEQGRCVTAHHGQAPDSN